MQAISAQGEQLIPLATAAQQLGITWDRAWRLMLRGALIGHRLENGRWAVTKESVAAQLANPRL